MGDAPYDKYARSRNVGDAYSRGGGDPSQDRNELFAGHDPSRSGSGRFPGSGGIPDRPPGEETEEDIEGIKKQTRWTKQESVQSSRNALQLAQEAEETARNTLTRLGGQSEKLANTERHLDVSKGYALRADDKTGELKQLNRSIFRPVITFNKDAKRAAQERKIQERYDDERDERERAAMDARETHARLGRAAGYGRGGDDEELLTGGQRSRGNPASKEQRKRFQFESTNSDDELEDELDGNLDQINDVSKRLKQLGMAMGQELDAQNTRIDRLAGKTDALDGRIARNTERLKKI